MASSGDQTVRTTAIPGLYLSRKESAGERPVSAEGISGTLLAARQEVHLDSGTEVVLGVFAAK